MGHGLEATVGGRKVRVGARRWITDTADGGIAIAVAHHCPDVEVDATDVSSDALAVAARNVERHGLAARVRLYEADLYPPDGARYCVVVSNPPYVPEAEVVTTLQAICSHHHATPHVVTV